MIAGTLELQLLANLARLSKDLTDAKGIVSTATKSMDSSIGAVKSAFAALGIGISAVGFGNLIKGSIDAMDHLNDLSKSTNLTVETLAGLKVAAKQSGGDLDSIAASINKLSVEMGKAPDKFKALGITAKDPLEAFKQLADVFNRIENPQQRAAVAATALGKSWAGAAPLLSEGSKKIDEMIKKGTEASGVTTKMAQQADELNDKWELLVGSGGLLNTIVGNMLEPLLKLTNQMLAAKEASSGLLESILRFMTIGGDVAADPGKELAEVDAKLIALKNTAAELDRMGSFQKWFSDDDIFIVQTQIAALEFKRKTLLELIKFPLTKVDVPPDKPLAKVEPKAIEDFLGADQGALAERKKLAQEIAQFNEHAGELELAQIRKTLDAAHDRWEQEKKDIKEAADLAADLEKEYIEARQKQLDAAQAVKDDFADKQKTDLDNLTNSLMSEDEIRKFAYEKDFNLLNDTLGMKTDAQEQYYTLMQRLVARNSQQEQAIERNKHAALRSMQMQTWQLGAELLQSLAGESKVAAIATLAISKALSIAQVVQQTAVASMAALAPPPVGLGPVAGGALAAEIKALGAIQVGIIAATGLVQAAGVGSGGADIGSPANPVNTTDSFGSAGSSATPAATSNQTTVIHLHGETYSRKQVKELVEKINENQRDGGRIVFA